MIFTMMFIHIFGFLGFPTWIIPFKTRVLLEEYGLVQEVTWCVFKLLPAHFPLGTETVVSVMGCFCFFFQKSTIEVLFTWSDSFPPFCPPYPLPAGNLENAKKLKVPHAESSLDVPEYDPEFMTVAITRGTAPSTSADFKKSCLPDTCPPPP